MNKIVVKLNTGRVAIICPTHEATPETMERDALASDGYMSHRYINDSQFPNDRTFRNAWTDDNPTETVDVDVPKAKEIKKDMMRKDREPLLKKLDIAFMIATEQNDNAAQSTIAAKKQELRDVTTLELPDDVEELKYFTPDCLKDNG